MQVTEERFDDGIDPETDGNPDQPEEDYLQAEEVLESSDAMLPAQHLSIWQMIRRFFIKSRAEQDADYQMRLYRLNDAIETYPAAAVNYVLRGELNLELKLPDAARSDFEQALKLAQEQFEQDRWGLSSQAIQDRARRGLKRVG